MRPERWQEIEGVLHTALELEDHERGGFLRQTCGDDRELFEEVLSLLESLANAGSFLEGCAADQIPEVRGTLEPPASLIRPLIEHRIKAAFADAFGSPAVS